MADEFKLDMHDRCAVGGLYCDCCNDFHSGDKEKLRRQTRRAMKQADKKLVDLVLKVSYNEANEL